MKRLKPNLPVPKTRDEVETLVGEITSLIITERQTKALLDKRTKELKDEYQDQLIDINERLTPRLLRVQAWAEANPAEFGKNRSVQMLHGTIGWRIGQPTLKTLSGWTWDRVLEAIRTACPQWVRTKSEVDKQSILAERENLLDGDLKLIGVKIVQEDSFYVEPAVSPDSEIQTG